jgi:hypothetical protein
MHELAAFDSLRGYFGFTGKALGFKNACKNTKISNVQQGLLSLL